MSLITMPMMAQNTEKPPKKTDVTFKVPMDCEDCIDKITHHMAFEKGVKNISCSLEQKTVTITYRTNKTNVEKLNEGLDKIGYKGELIDTDKSVQR